MSSHPAYLVLLAQRREHLWFSVGSIFGLEFIFNRRCSSCRSLGRSSYLEIKLELLTIASVLRLISSQMVSSSLLDGIVMSVGVYCLHIFTWQRERSSTYKIVYFRSSALTFSIKYFCGGFVIVIK